MGNHSLLSPKKVCIYEYCPSKTCSSFMINYKIGREHIWLQKKQIMNVLIRIIFRNDISY